MEAKSIEPTGLTTKEFARINGVEPGTVRAAVYRCGEYFGAKPARQQNGYLCWPRIVVKR